MGAERLVEIWRGAFLESTHDGHAVICDASGAVVQVWGDPTTMILPRSSCKMIQALPLIESGAADRYGLTDQHLALACASHQGAAIHTDRVSRWLADLELTGDDLRCGPQLPPDLDARNKMIQTGGAPCQIHNNCSGKHSGFLTLNKHIGGGSEYIDPDHPIQVEVRDAFQDVTGEVSPGFGIDGCSAPNYACSVQGLAVAMARFSKPGGNLRGQAMKRLVRAMVTHPELVAGTTRACTELMNAMGGKVAIKTGAEGVFTAILPEQGLGIALKIADGATRASECAMAAILVELGVLDPDHPATKRRLNAPVTNRRGVVTGVMNSRI